MENTEIIKEMLEKHWSKNVTQAMEITSQLFEKSLQDLEFLLEVNKSEPIRKLIKLVMEVKIKAM